jgi:hypothetical protein
MLKYKKTTIPRDENYPKENCKKWYEEHKEQHKAKMLSIVACIHCNSPVTKVNILRHLQTRKCLKLQNESNKIIIEPESTDSTESIKELDKSKKYNKLITDEMLQNAINVFKNEIQELKLLMQPKQI